MIKNELELIEKVYTDLTTVDIFSRKRILGFLVNRTEHELLTAQAAAQQPKQTKAVKPRKEVKES